MKKRLTLELTEAQYRALAGAVARDGSELAEQGGTWAAGRSRCLDRAWAALQQAWGRAPEVRRGRVDPWDNAVDWLLNSRHTGDPDIQDVFWGIVDGLVSRREVDENDHAALQKARRLQRKRES